MRTIIPLVQKHCINGITKEDAENIREIPELDERVTALENASVENNWVDTDYENATPWNSSIYSKFYDTDTQKVTKDVILSISVYNYNQETSYTINEYGYLLIPKNTSLDDCVFSLGYYRKFIDENNKTHIYYGDMVADSEKIERIFMKNATYGGNIYDAIPLRQDIIDFNLTDGTITTPNISISVIYVPTGAKLKLLYNDITEE